MSIPSPADNRRFNISMAITCAAVVSFSFLGSRFTGVRFEDGANVPLGYFICLAAPLTLVAYWQARQRLDMREGALALMWAVTVLFSVLLAVDVCGRADMPLQDANLVRIDQALGVNVPALAQWAVHHALGRAINATYSLLVSFLLPLAILAPALFGRWIAARELVAGNLVATIIGFAAFAAFPAIGPWYGYHLPPPGPGQAACQAELLLLRAPGAFSPHTAGIVCFPSFHVVWAMLCARALSTFRLLRIPVTLFAGVIVLSTLTTGWHYFVDVLGGFGVASISMWIASRMSHVPHANALVPPPPVSEIAISN